MLVHFTMLWPFKVVQLREATEYVLSTLKPDQTNNDDVLKFLFVHGRLKVREEYIIVLRSYHVSNLNVNHYYCFELYN